MSLARAIVELDKLVRENKTLDPFLPGSLRQIIETPEGETIVDRLNSCRLEGSADVVNLCLQALQIQHHELEPQLVRCELVATIPPGVPGIAIPTDRVIREMLEPPIAEVILLGYEVTESDVVEQLARASDCGAEVIMICDREKGVAERVSAAWPAGSKKPRLYHDTEREDASAYAAMHAKCLLVDGNDLLVTSANFTFHGLKGNIEIGIRLSGRACSEARKLFSYLVENKIVEEYMPRNAA